MSTQTAPGGSTLQTDSLTGLHWAGVALSAVTGVIHLWLAWAFRSEAGMAVAFLVAGVGFLGGIAAVLLEYRRRLFYLLGIPFTAGQIPLWYVANAPEFGATGIADKVVQVALIAVLVVLYRRES
ncbi:hypothetical protein Hbl1158_01115 [Halobaculum sp. CBA1158]|uniref:DUF7475 family protein n=1 Tax=Halobaculum sp. CBA1158 TaxID=2904243 RepID=UPI001F200BD4|nr:hypothetical protein [Halobaculum sp. CBA1158]UIP00001.1 hypothetical protein Hbl1158_01115 [Halobaculum sp. CBA1158]